MLWQTSDKGGNGPIGVDPQLDPVELKLEIETICGNCMASMGKASSGKMVCPNCKTVFNIQKEKE